MNVTYAWERPVVHEQSKPSPRSKHACCMFNKCVYLHGGRNGHVALKDLWKYDPTTCIWTEIKGLQGDSPPSPWEHTLVPYKGKIYVFGGVYGVNDCPLFCYDVLCNSWERLAASNQGAKQPLSRRGHTSVVYRTGMHVFGGYQDLSGSNNEHWAYNFESHSWHELNGDVKEIPPPRHYHSAVAYSDSMWVYGGIAHLQRMSDLWKWNFVYKSWTRIRSKSGPGPLSGHSACVVAGSMLIFGGESDSASSNDLWKFNFSDLTWTKVLIEKLPSCRSQHATALVNSVLFGSGYTFSASEPCLQPVKAELPLSARPDTCPPDLYSSSVHYSKLDAISIETITESLPDMCDNTQDKNLINIAHNPLQKFASKVSSSNYNYTKFDEAHNNIQCAVIGIDKNKKQELRNSMQKSFLPAGEVTYKHFYNSTFENELMSDCDENMYCPQKSVGDNRDASLEEQSKSGLYSCTLCTCATGSGEVMKDSGECLVQKEQKIAGTCACCCHNIIQKICTSDLMQRSLSCGDDVPINKSFSNNQQPCTITSTSVNEVRQNQPTLSKQHSGILHDNGQYFILPGAVSSRFSKNNSIDLISFSQEELAPSVVEQFDPILTFTSNGVQIPLDNLQAETVHKSVPKQVAQIDDINDAASFSGQLLSSNKAIPLAKKGIVNSPPVLSDKNVSATEMHQTNETVCDLPVSRSQKASNPVSCWYLYVFGGKIPGCSSKKELDVWRLAIKFRSGLDETFL